MTHTRLMQHRGAGPACKLEGAEALGVIVSAVGAGPQHEVADLVAEDGLLRRTASSASTSVTALPLSCRRAAAPFRHRRCSWSSAVPVCVVREPCSRARQA